MALKRKRAIRQFGNHGRSRPMGRSPVAGGAGFYCGLRQAGADHNCPLGSRSEVFFCTMVGSFCSPAETLPCPCIARATPLNALPPNGPPAGEARPSRASRRSFSSPTTCPVTSFPVRAAPPGPSPRPSRTNCSWTATPSKTSPPSADLGGPRGARTHGAGDRQEPDR